MGSSLMRRFASGDPEAVRELYATYGKAVYTVASSSLRDRGLAEEAVQLTFLQAWRSARSFDPERDPAPWLYAIARRTAVDVYRRERRHLGRQSLDTAADMAVLPESFERTWEAWQIRLALEQMPAAQRQIVEALHFVGLTHEEAARQLGLPIGTVKSRSHRAHRRLATLLDHLNEATA
jgi:RNA polymerase sigma-70 factor (ECF subfamily)